MFARVLGLGAAVTTGLLWCFLLWDGTINGGITGGTYVVGAIMMLLALLAAWGTLTAKPLLLIIAFVGSFVPVGLYMLGAPSIFVLVGVANLLYLFVGVLIFLEQRTGRSS
jgi:hypothetical protein